MFDTIKQVITDAISGTAAAPYVNQYASVIDKVAADVSTHVSKCSEDLMEKAVSEFDLPADAVREAFVEAGLAVEREPEVVAEAGTADSNTEARLTAIETTLARLSAIAERAERSGYLR